MNTELDSYQYVRQLLVEQFDVPAEDIQPSASLADDLGIDSIDAVDMIVHMREVTGKRLTPEQFRTVRTVQDVVSIVDHVRA
ncbi:MAG: acyl carrier protein [Xanthomonadales bacterium]|nr:acyl carrier protein [Xanthomonadales bacterium]